MRVIGLKGPSRERLREALRDVEGTFVWGCGTLRGYAQLWRLDYADVPTPKFTYIRPTAIQWLVEGHTVLGRSIHHTQGKDIIPWKLEWGEATSKWQQKDFWSLYTPLTAEFRVHVFGSVLAVGQKVQIEPSLSVLASSGVEIRARRCGWRIHYNRTHLHPRYAEIKALGLRAVEALSYPYGAVDIGLAESGALLVLEVNGAPSLKNDTTLGWYVDAIKLAQGE